MDFWKQALKLRAKGAISPNLYCILHLDTRWSSINCKKIIFIITPSAVYYMSKEFEGSFQNIHTDFNDWTLFSICNHRNSVCSALDLIYNFI